MPSSRLAAFALAALAFFTPALAAAASSVPLTLEKHADVLTIVYDGKPASDTATGIPSWRVVIRRDDGGNITSLHIPAHDPASLSSGRRQWPLSIVQAKNTTNVTGTMDKGRENYVGHRVETFDLVEESAARIVLRVGGPSPTKHFLHERTYTFTPAGVQIEGWLEPHLEMRSVAFDPHWDRRHIADSHIPVLPVRTQGQTSWRYMPSAGSDAAVPLPPHVDFPLEAELRLRRATPTFVRIFYDRVFECAEGKRLFIHNVKDQPEGLGPQARLAYEKLAGITGGPAAKGVRQNFKVRFVFETQHWPGSP